ncbi:cyclic GMP-AMP synthase [Solenopsis invicta]|uniref:cyclic GMP-AMP synthase n=1 Tax=Solenopsis invicta TaxID=13686 RepID=UPI00193D6B8E|nr:cyclic GMP-AMP synthase [Solenopsis invicta]
MMPVEDISKYLVDDTIFNKISKRFISMDPDDMKYNNRLLEQLFDKLIDAMKEQSPLFANTFQRIVWAGSYYKGTRYGQPEEYDLNFVINLPIKEQRFSTDQPGFIKIHTDWKDRYSYYTSKYPKVYQEINRFIDEQSYLNQEKFRTWMEGIFSKVANANGENNIIKFDGHAPIKMKKSGPAFTLKCQSPNGKTIDIDVVPVLVFPNRTPPPRCSKLDILESHPNRYWSAVPKPLDNRGGFGDIPYRYWRLCFYECEKKLLEDHYYQHMKPVIRQLKKLRDTQKWESVASYYLETLCYNEKELFHTSQKNSLTFLFFTMLKKLRVAFINHCIRYYWDDDLNLLENIKNAEVIKMKGRIDRILKCIETNIGHDPYAIAKFVLNREQLNCLKNMECVSTAKSDLESESETASQWSCVIV